MKLSESLKWSCAVAVSAVLSGCFVNDPVYEPQGGAVQTPRTNNPNPMYAPNAPEAQQVVPTNRGTPPKPVQAERPGPKQEAAPQLPVIE